MWIGSHFGTLDAELWGELECCLNGIFDELFVPFPDLTQEAAAVDEENLCVDSEKATLEVEAETNGEMYVSGNDFVAI